MDDFVHTAKVNYNFFLQKFFLYFQFAGLFYGLTIIAGFFSTAFVMMVSLNALFLHRPIYKMQKEKIDKIMGTVCDMYTKHSKMIVDKIPKYVEAVKKN